MESFFARRITEADIIVIDEITMLHKVVFENVEALIRKLTGSTKFFGGKVVLIGGDWKQSLPVVTEGGLPAQVAACIQSSQLYQHFRKVKLNQIVRIQRDHYTDWWINFLRDIGEGRTGDFATFPEWMIVNSREELINFVFDSGFSVPAQDLLKRLLLSPLNTIVDILNEKASSQLTADEHTYNSINKVLIYHFFLSIHLLLSYLNMIHHCWRAVLLNSMRLFCKI